ncbi:MAG TPA: hypothetical protein VGO16_11145 [Pseudonocardiaceae bacterium]|nr:hypothetical protein [Pseudonocardiaceae bacterium]
MLLATVIGLPTDTRVPRTSLRDPLRYTSPGEDIVSFLQGAG